MLQFTCPIWATLKSTVAGHKIGLLWQAKKPICCSLALKFGQHCWWIVLYMLLLCNISPSGHPRLFLSLLPDSNYVLLWLLTSFVTWLKMKIKITIAFDIQNIEHGRETALFGWIDFHSHQWILFKPTELKRAILINYLLTQRWFNCYSH